MKILLVALGATYSHVNLAVHLLAASCREAGLDAHPLELHINQPPDAMLAAILAYRPDVVAFSVYIWNRTLAERLAGDLRRACPHLRILAGGPEATFDAERLLSDSDAFDAVCMGEGEESLPAYLRIGYHPGVSVRQGDGRVLWGQYQHVRDLDTLPIPDIYRNPDALRNRIVYMETARGCPFRCAYCLSSAMGGGIRIKSLARVKEELSLLAASGVTLVKLVDRTFNIDEDRAIALLDLFEEIHPAATFHLEMAGDLSQERLMARLSSLPPGLVQAEIGVQSTHPPTLEAIGRTCRLSVLQRNVTALMNAGNIHVHLDLIAGLPHEDVTVFAQSFDFVYALRPHHMQVGFLKLLPGTRLYDEADTHSLVCRGYPPYEVLATRWLSPQDVLSLKSLARTVEIFYNSGRFIHTLAYLLDKPDAPPPFSFYCQLAAYMDQQGYALQNGSLGTLYTLLWQFSGSGEDVRHYLALDFFLSGQSAKPPAFLPPLLPDAYREKAKEALHCDAFWQTHFPGLSRDEIAYKRKRLRLAYIDLPGFQGLYALDPDSADPVTGRRLFFPMR